MTERLYRDDPYLLEFEASVVARRVREGRPAVVLDRTAFYAESGGQPWDTGTLEGVPVLAVVEEGEDVLHVLAAPLATDRVHGRVDADRRRDHRQQHHGQHLLSRAFVDVASARTVSFHLGAEVSSIDLDRDVGDHDVRAAERRANEVVWQARPVSVRTVPRREALALGVDVPPEAGDSVRLVHAEGFDLQACGGTHPRNTAEVGFVLVLGRERYKGGARVRFICGHRAIAAMHASLATLDRLGSLLSTTHEGAAEAAERLLERLGEGEKHVRELRERALEGEARRLLMASPARGGTTEGEPAASTPAVIVATYEGWPPDDLRVLAVHLVTLAPCVALLGSRAEKAHLVFAQSEGLGHDIPTLIRDAAGRLGGRGGGKGNLAQGGGDRVEALGEALASAASAVTGTLRAG